MTTASGGDVVYGRNAVREALRGRRRVREVVVAGRAPELDWLAGVSAPVRVVRAEDVEALAGSPDHQGVAARVTPYPYVDADALAAQDRPLLVALDEVTDPRNLGAIARSAEAAGATGLVLPRHRSAVVTPAVCKASAGAVEHLAVAVVRNLADWLVGARRSGLWSYAATLDPTSRLYTEVDLVDGAVLVLGSEGKGVRPRVARVCDEAVRLPMLGRVQSLNVSVAAGVLLYEAVRQREAARSGRGSRDA